ncbi:hypothetical protein [Rhizobium sp. ZW T2_16]|uniref:hypothetical protein n=1 Tax=Rhizobium sp. ZW T2_16 TaxID=3378083 RepID=UPI003854219E
MEETSIYIDITSGTNEPPPLGANGEICAIGLNARLPEGGTAQGQLNADDVILKKITAKVRSDPSLFGRVESIMVFEHERVTGIVHIVTGGIFRKQTPDLREYESGHRQTGGTSGFLLDGGHGDATRDRDVSENC